ncbi:MAG: helix-hairpin-helix domain-containing protein [Bacteroidota bacterium]
MSFRCIFVVLGCMIYGVGLCQELRVVENEIEDIVEAVAAGDRKEIDLSIISEDLNFYLNHPLDLNTADSEDLSRLHILNPFQIHSLQDYIRKHGALLSIYELPLVFGFSSELAEKLKPFVTLDGTAQDQALSGIKPRDMLRRGKHELVMRSGKVLETQKGYRNLPDSLKEEHPNKMYLGSAFSLYSRYLFRYRDQRSFGLTMEKDPGEELFKGSNPYGYDFNSAHLFLSDIRWVDRLIIGDYKVRYGQGLIAWMGFSLDKSPMVMNMMKNIHRIDPYTSKNENNFFRGIAFEKKIGAFRGSFFYSRRKRDANVLDLPESEGLVVTSLLETGYHRIPRELEDKNVMGEQVFGGSLTWNQPNSRISVNGMNCVFGGELQKRTRLYQMYDFSGSRLSNLSLDYRFSLGRFYLFGEEALSIGGGTGFLNGLYGQLTSEMGVVLLHRSYKRNYQTLYSGAFSEKSGVQNESGLYMGLKADILPSLELKGYMDAYRFPWLSYLTDGPSEGWDCLVDMEYLFQESSSVNLRFRRTEEVENHAAPERKLASLEPLKKTNIRCHLHYRVADRIVLKNRIEKVFVRSQTSSSGLLLYQDICFKPENGSWGADFRYALFDTDGYQTRIYAYENDVLYAFSVPAYQGKGYRSYINLKYRHGNTEWWLKFARTGYIDRETIGTGLNQIDGNSKTGVNFQVRLKF